MNRPFSGACEQNKQVIQAVLDPYLKDSETTVLEVGSGTGQHAVYFGAHYPQCLWQTSDRNENLNGINRWINEAALANLPSPIELDVSGRWPKTKYDIIFSANALHIMNEAEAEVFMSNAYRCLKPNGYLIVYGPFNYQNEYTSESNRQFDQWLKARDPASGIKHFEWINASAEKTGLTLIDDIEMPANNRSIIWQFETSPTL